MAANNFKMVENGIKVVKKGGKGLKADENGCKRLSFLVSKVKMVGNS